MCCIDRLKWQAKADIQGETVKYINPNLITQGVLLIAKYL